MVDLQIGVGLISLRIRQAQALKDKRRVVTSLVQKMRNAGMSATECGNQDNPKVASVGFSFAGSSIGQVNDRFDEVSRLLLGDFEVLEFHKETVDYSNPYEPTFSQSILDDKYQDDE